ncbi:MAG: DUF4340 domain-containing protein [Oligoflexales bacterium]|nr:DUF4340 domain-containing protein [Oligoflexales bacterium]
MVSKKILAVVGALALIALLTLVIEKREGSKDLKDIEKSLFQIEKIPEVSGIEISQSDKKVKVVRDENNRWIVDGNDKFPASATTVVKFLENISEIKLIRLISDKREKWNDLELEKGARVSLFSGDKALLKLVLGKRREGNGQFVAFEDSTKSYLADKVLSFFQESSAWELKTLLDLKKDDLKEINFMPKDLSKKKSFKFVREKKEDSLKLSDRGEKEKEKDSEISSLYGMFSSLSYSQRQPKDSQQKELFSKADSVSVSTFDGRSYSILVAKVEKKTPPEKNPPSDKDKNKKVEKEMDYYVTMNLSGTYADSSGDGKFFNAMMDKWVFKVEPYQAKRFLREREEFLEKKQ